jgi:hypothetical protein
MATTYCTETPASNGNLRTFTISFWVKRGKEGAASATSQQIIGQTVDQYFRVMFKDDNTLRCYDQSGFNFITTRKFSDINSWYHIVLRIDTTQNTEADRARLYVNGVLQTAYGTQTYPALNVELHFNRGQLHSIGRSSSSGGYDYFEGVLSEFCFIDGGSLGPDSFGETDTETGQWRLKELAANAFTWGTNGYRIFHNGNSVTDSSTNSNNWTAYGSLTNTNDCPSNVFAVLNRLDSDLTTDPFQYGNTQVSGQNPESAKYYCGLTLGMMGNGKYYFEGQLNVNNQGILGVCNLDASDNPTYLRQQNTFPGRYSSSWGYDFTDGYKFNNNNKTAYGSGTSWTANDYFSFALDNTNGKMYIAKNGSWVSGGDPTNGTGGIDYSAIGDNNMFIVADNNSAGYNKFTFNFGNGSFDTTTLSTTYSPTVGDTSAKFKYNIIPTGYTALSTKGLNI